MRTYKFIAAGLALAGLLSASVASAQTATTTSGGAVLPSSNADLAVAIGGNGIILDATHSSVPVQVSALPLSVSGAVGGTCTISNAGTSVGTLGTSGSVDFNNAITVPAGSMVTLPVTCTGGTPGTYNVSLVTSVIPAIVANTNTSITPRGIGGASNNDTLAVGTLTIGSGGTGSVSGSGSTSGSGSVLGTSTGASLPGSTGSNSTSGSGSAVLGASTGTPNVPNTGAGGSLAMNLAILALAGLAAVGGGMALRRATR
jgi:hypothetical protein